MQSWSWVPAGMARFLSGRFLPVRPDLIGWVTGQFLLILAGTLLVPLAVAVFTGGSDALPLVKAFLITIAAAGLSLAVSRTGHGATAAAISHREGILLLVICWLCSAFFGSLPFYLSTYFPSFTDAFFESASGFSTTGASILPDVQVLPPGLQFWRHFTHWLGGIGIVTLMIAILPLVSIGGEQLYRAQVAGIQSEKLTPRIVGTVYALWRVYLALTIGQYVALRLAGMTPFDALCHTFSTLGTGGFSTRNASVGAFDNPAIDYIIVFFMLLASISFAQHYRLMVELRPRAFISDPEVRAHLGIIAAATLLVASTLILQSGYSYSLAGRRALFQVTSIATCTGFATDDYEKWRPFCQFLMIALMYVGGNTGSTAGGLKTMRVLILLHLVKRETRQRSEARGVFVVRVGNQVISEYTCHCLLALVYTAVLFNLGAALLVAASGVDILTSITSVTSAMFTVGPGLGGVGPADNYSALPGFAKWVLSMTMLAGRLEFFPALVLFTSSFWRR